MFNFTFIDATKPHKLYPRNHRRFIKFIFNFSYAAHLYTRDNCHILPLNPRLSYTIHKSYKVELNYIFISKGLLYMTI